MFIYYVEPEKEILLDMCLNNIYKMGIYALYKLPFCKQEGRTVTQLIAFH